VAIQSRQTSFFLFGGTYVGLVHITDKNSGEEKTIRLLPQKNGIYTTCEFPWFYFEDKDEESAKVFIRKIPADLLLAIDFKKIFIDLIQDPRGAFADIEEYTIYCNDNLNILGHEFAHQMDFEESSSKISLDKDLVKTYEEELSKFNQTFSKRIEKKLIKYFSQNGGVIEHLRKFEDCEENDILFPNAGLSELLADAFSMTLTYGNDDEVICERLHFAKRFFPKTIAKCIELTQKKIQEEVLIN
jgi:hypothetical protein